MSYIFYGNQKMKQSQLTKELLGGKGLGLFEMAGAGVPVPDFLVIPTSMCVEYMKDPMAGRTVVAALVPTIIHHFQKTCGELPLLSVRSGARVSMPGMMDTVLNVGIGDERCASYVGKLSPRARNDCMRRFQHMYGSTVFGIPSEEFEDIMAYRRKVADVVTDADLTEEALAYVIQDMDYVFEKHIERACDYVVEQQIENCIIAVMESWNSERAVAYRDHNKIPHDWGTAVVVQRMVMGNMNDDSGSGVLFSRDPVSGINEITGEFLPNAQGEDVVAGIRTPLPLSDMATQWPDVSDNLSQVVHMLEAKYNDMLDIEFTVENGKLFLLQVRVAKRSARATVRCALDMFLYGNFEADEVFKRIKRSDVRLLSQPVVADSYTQEPYGQGIPACAGVAIGKAVFTKEQAIAATEPCILIRHETSPDDIAGMFAAVGIITATGGSTSHAAVVARGMDKVCVTGIPNLTASDKGAAFNGVSIGLGDLVTVCGNTGRVWVHETVPVSDPSSDKDLADLMTFVTGDTEYDFETNLPTSSGNVYYMTQFLADVPAHPREENLYVIDNLPQLEGPEKMLALCTGANAAHKDASDRMTRWAVAHSKNVTVYTNVAEPKIAPKNMNFVKNDKSLKFMMNNPTSESQLVGKFGATLEDLRELLAPAKLEDKVKLITCSRHRLMSAFAQGDA